MYFSFPSAPRKGESRLVISVDKGNPALRQIMDKCINKVAIPELTFAESSTRARAVTELGPRPTDIPQFFEYKLKDVSFSECPIVEDALEQAVVLTFSDIEWLNFKGDTRQSKYASAGTPGADKGDWFDQILRGVLVCRRPRHQ